jgi:hypothetical protein
MTRIRPTATLLVALLALALTVLTFGTTTSVSLDSVAFYPDA